VKEVIQIVDTGGGVKAVCFKCDPKEGKVLFTSDNSLLADIARSEARYHELAVWGHSVIVLINKLNSRI